MKTKSTSQDLIDITFQIAGAVRDNPDCWDTHEECMVWVADQLNKCGYTTIQVGASWGMLTDIQE